MLHLVYLNFLIKSLYNLKLSVQMSKLLSNPHQPLEGRRLSVADGYK